MKALSFPRNARCRLGQFAAACAGLLKVCRPNLGRARCGRGGASIISGSHGIYFLPGEIQSSQIRK